MSIMNIGIVTGVSPVKAAFPEKASMSSKKTVTGAPPNKELKLKQVTFSEEEPPELATKGAALTGIPPPPYYRRIYEKDSTTEEADLEKRIKEACKIFKRRYERWEEQTTQ